MQNFVDSLKGKSPLFLFLSAALVGESIALCYYLFINRAKQKELLNVQEQLTKQTNLRAVERAGRIAAQQANRETFLKATDDTGYNYHPIGFVESPFPDRRGTPRQPMLVPAARGKIRFDRKIIQNEHFKELDQFSHVWVVFVFHNNTNAEKASKSSKIKPPRLHGAKVGCLSTRSPHRPNNIGLSVCEIIGVGEDYIELRSIDMVHRTPVLDGKE